MTIHSLTLYTFQIRFLSTKDSTKQEVQLLRNQKRGLCRNLLARNFCPEASEDESLDETIRTLWKN